MPINDAQRQAVTSESKKLLVLAGLTLVFMGCENETKTTSKVFNRLGSDQSGVNFSNTLTETDSLNYLTYAYMYIFMYRWRGYID